MVGEARKQGNTHIKNNKKGDDKMVYGEYLWNVRFRKGMRAIREGKINRFQIVTEEAIHNFKKIGDNLIERKSHYFSNFGEPTNQYVYYDLSGRRLCPIHLKRLISEDDWIGLRDTRKCPVEGCDYISERYCITDYETKPREQLIKELKKKKKID